MTSLPKTPEGLSQAITYTQQLARNHPRKAYCVYVGRSNEDSYSISLACLIRQDMLDESNLAFIVTAQGKVISMFPKGQS